MGPSLLFFALFRASKASLRDAYHERRKDKGAESEWGSRIKRERGKTIGGKKE